MEVTHELILGLTDIDRLSIKCKSCGAEFMVSLNLLSDANVTDASSTNRQGAVPGHRSRFPPARSAAGPAPATPLPTICLNPLLRSPFRIDSVVSAAIDKRQRHHRRHLTSCPPFTLNRSWRESRTTWRWRKR
jgi:hypothetical protein